MLIMFVARELISLMVQIHKSLRHSFLVDPASNFRGKPYHHNPMSTTFHILPNMANEVETILDLS